MQMITKDILDRIIDDYKSGFNIKYIKDKYNISENTIRKTLKEAGVFKPRTHKFTEKDIDFLRENYPNGNWDIILNHFKDSTKQSIMTIASKNGIKMINDSSWSEDEIEIIKKYYKEDIGLVKKLLPNRSESAIRTKAQKLNIRTREFWSFKDNELLTEIYPKMPVDDVVKMFPNRSRNSIIKHAIVLNLQSYDYNPWTKEEDDYIRTHYKNEADAIMCKKLGRTYRATQHRRLMFGLYHFNKDWSGYEGMSKFLRGHLSDWKMKSMEKCGYKCVITGSKDFEIHHLYCFSNIVNETFDTYNIDTKKYSEYSQEELSYILEKFLSIHSNYPLGVCVRKDIHSLYHSLYSKCVNNEEQWNEFITDYKNGKYLNKIA